MKKIKLYLFLLTLILLIPLNVNAERSVADEQKLLNLSKEINYNYKYESDNNFKITFYNINDKLIVTDDIGIDFNNGIASKRTYKSGYSTQFSVVASSNTNCPYQTIKTISIKFPIYNEYSKNEKCKQDKYLNFKYCKEFLNEEITENKWNTELKKYENNLNNNIINNEKRNNFIDTKILITIGAGFLLLIIIIIGISIKKRKERKI